VSKKIFAYWSHYFNSHSHPCPGSECACKPPLQNLKREWHGILHVVNVQTRKELFLEVTNHCAILFRDQCPDPDNLRGLRARFCRSAGADNSRLRGYLDSIAAMVSELPAERDPAETLSVLFASKKPIAS
jgi:hypothetical protein